MYIGKPTDVLIRLYESGTYEYGSTYPALGITYDMIDGFIWKQDEVTWAPIGILPSEWSELGDGYYILNLRSSLVDRLGPVAIKISGAEVATTVKEDFIEPLPPLFAVDPSKCVVYGNIMDLTGETGNKDYTIEFALVSLPHKVGGVSLVSADKITCRPDAFGNFSVIILCGTTVFVSIERAGIKNKIIIPTTNSANLIDLLPPF